MSIRICPNCKSEHGRNDSLFCTQLCFDIWYEKQQMKVMKETFERIFPSIKVIK